MIKRSFRWTRQPQERLGVNWDHPLARDLIEFGYMVAGKVPHSAAQLGRYDQPSVTGTATPEITKHGHATTVSGTGNYINLNRNISAPTMVASGWVRTRTNGASTVSALLTSAGAQATNYVGHDIISNTGDGVLRAAWGDGSGATDGDRRWADSPGSTVVVGETASYGFVCRAAADWSIYKNGASLSVSYGGTAGTYAPGTGNGTINFRNANTRYGNQTVSAWAYWSRDLTDAEFWELEWAPFQLLTPYTRRVWVSVAGAYTLTADAGSYTLTGQAATLTASRIITADAGSFALAGQDAALLRGYPLTADVGAFTLAGQDAGLIAARLLTADAGSFTLTGQDATLNKGVTLVADAGTFTLAGQDAGLTATRLLTADAGSFTLSGQDATLTKGVTLTADAGTFALTGQAATLTVARVLSAEAGAFALAGQDATLTKSGDEAVSAGGDYQVRRKRARREVERLNAELLADQEPPDDALPPVQNRTRIRKKRATSVTVASEMDAEIARLIQLAIQDEEDAEWFLLAA